MGVHHQRLAWGGAGNPQCGRQGPDPYEDLARQRLEPILGPLREIDPGGGPQPLHDFEATLPEGMFAALVLATKCPSAGPPAHPGNYRSAARAHDRHRCWCPKGSHQSGR